MVRTDPNTYPIKSVIQDHIRILPLFPLENVATVLDLHAESSFLLQDGQADMSLPF